jgi:DegV family protein with EDD domain
MSHRFREALQAGSEAVTVWADYLDGINVFPVADGDTGRNLVLSLSPLRDVARPPVQLREDLLLSARGNSGNIAAQFFIGLLDAGDWRELPAAVARGNELAWRTLPNPKTGTILSYYQALSGFLAGRPATELAACVEPLRAQLVEAVLSTTRALPELNRAGVVDAGALGMFFFFDRFFAALFDVTYEESGPPARLKAVLDRPVRPTAEVASGFCFDAVLRGSPDQLAADFGGLGESVVTFAQGNLCKVHFHADDPATAKAQLAKLGAVVRLSVDDLGEQSRRFGQQRQKQAIHVLTDAAGSLTRADAERHGFTLMDSYITIGAQSLPETYVDPATLYEAMRRDVKVSTSQASAYERHAHYRKVLDLHPRALYVCVGSVFTGNYQVAREWCGRHDAEGRLHVLDTAAASGRLGLIALATAQLATQTDDADEVIAFADSATRSCVEYMFLDRLKYLAAGGRLSKTSSFFGELFHVKPIISPLAEGAKKVGVARDQAEQRAFADEALSRAFGDGQPGWLMVEYTDNEAWVREELTPEFARRYPAVTVFAQPFSLTTGAHIGPGSWGIAFLPAATE